MDVSYGQSRSIDNKTALIIKKVRAERNNLASIYLVFFVPNPLAFSYPFVSSI